MKPRHPITDLSVSVSYFGTRVLKLGMTKYGTLCKKTIKGWRYLTLAEKLHVNHVLSL